MNEKPRGEGLSPSSLATFLGCQRRYYFKKVGKIAPDADVSDDVEALQIGKAFHKCLEDTKHELSGYGLKQVAAVCEAEGLTEVNTGALVFAMLGKYGLMHKKAGLKAIACEVVVNTEAFYGIVDVVLIDEKTGNWWIGDMKTAATFRADIIPSLPLHPQLSLYAYHFPDVAAAAGVTLTKYQGCRYRLTTKSKISRKASEDVNSYIGRLAASVKSFDFIVPKERMRPAEVYSMHRAAEQAIKARGKECAPSLYPQNLSNCMNYFRPCEFWSQCHGAQFSDMLEVGLECITSET